MHDLKNKNQIITLRLNTGKTKDVGSVKLLKNYRRILLSNLPTLVLHETAYSFNIIICYQYQKKQARVFYGRAFIAPSGHAIIPMVMDKIQHAQNDRRFIDGTTHVFYQPIELPQ
jgi:hypothetical protein